MSYLIPLDHPAAREAMRVGGKAAALAQLPADVSALPGFVVTPEAFDEEGLLRLLRLARIGCSEIFQAQLKATGR